MHVGIADHLGWAVLVTASEDHEVVDRRRVELVEAGVQPMPIHHGIEGLDDDAAATVVAEVRASAARATAAAFDELAITLDAPVTAISLRVMPVDFPTDIAVLRRAPHEARADAVMYRAVMADAAAARGWDVSYYDAKTVEDRATQILGARADDVLRGPRARLGPPWSKDHRIALAAAIVRG